MEGGGASSTGMPRQGSPGGQYQEHDPRGVIVTATGAYSIDYDAGYEARKERTPGAGGTDKYEKYGGANTSANYGRSGRTGLSPTEAHSPGASGGMGYLGAGAGAGVSRSELIQNCESNYERERSRSGETRRLAQGSESHGRGTQEPQPRRYAP